jgi:hypothetical protein
MQARLDKEKRERERVAFREKQRQELLKRRQEEAARLGRTIDPAPSQKPRGGVNMTEATALIRASVNTSISLRIPFLLAYIVAIGFGVTAGAVTQESLICLSLSSRPAGGHGHAPCYAAVGRFIY